MTSYQSQRQRTQSRDREPGSGVGYMILALFLGLLVVVLGFFALWMWADARDARDGAAVATSAHGDHNVALPLSSFAGTVAENATELAEAHHGHRRRRCRRFPRATSSRCDMTLKDMVVEIAPGVTYNTWAFDGHGAPGPGRPRPRGPDGRDDADERRLDPALDRLPRRPDRAECRLPRRGARRVVHVPLQGGRSRRLHVPLRDEAGARAHRQRHVRRDRRPSRRKGCRPSTTSTSSSAASGT